MEHLKSKCRSIRNFTTFVVMALAFTTSVVMAGTAPPMNLPNLKIDGKNAITDEALGFTVTTSAPKALVPPKMSTTTRGNFSSPFEGMFIFNTNGHYPEWYTGAAWRQPLSQDGTETATNKTIAIGSNTVTGTASTIAAFNSLGTMVGSTSVGTSNGGTGKDLSASTGIMQVLSGVVTAGSVSLTSQISGTLPIANGGTSQTTANAALNALLPSQGSNATKFLQTDGTNTSWQASASGAAAYTVVSKTANYSASVGDWVKVDASGGAFTVTLPTAVGVSGQKIVVDRSDMTLTTLVTIARTSGQNIDGVAANVSAATQNEKWVFVSDNVGWRVERHESETPWSSPVANTITGSTSPPTIGTGTVVNTIEWRRSGMWAYIRQEISYTVAGAVGSGAYLFLTPVPIGSAITPSTSAGVGLDSLVRAKSALDGTTWAYSSNPVRGQIQAFAWDTTHFMLGGILSGTVEWVGSGAAIKFNENSVGWRITFRYQVDNWSQ